MASEVSICNEALNLLGEDSILSLQENSKAGRLCNLLYDDTRNQLLRLHPWNFATKRVALSKLSTVPAFGFDAEFQLPSDYLKVQRLEDSSAKFKIENGRKLLIDDSSVNIMYTARITDPNQFDELFRTALSAKLAEKMAYPLSDSLKLLEKMEARFVFSIRDARTMDAQEGTPENIENDDWTSSRI